MPGPSHGAAPRKARARASSDVSEATDAEPAFDDTSDSDDTDAAMLASGTATPPLTATAPSATNQVSEHSADVNSAGARAKHNVTCCKLPVMSARRCQRGLCMHACQVSDAQQLDNTRMRLSCGQSVSEKAAHRLRL